MSEQLDDDPERTARIDRLASALFIAFGATGGTSSVPILRPVAEMLDAFGVVQSLQGVLGQRYQAGRF